MNNFRRIQRFVNIKTILAAFVVLGTLYSFATPIFEKPDDPQHFAYLKMLVDGRGLPGQLRESGVDSPLQESSQPPSYYLVAALPVRLLAPNTDDFTAWLRPNLGWATSLADNDNKNIFIHLADERTTWQHTIMALHVARLIALLLGAVAVWATYRIGREVFPGASAIALVAAAIVAFLPQFLFISSSASNDSTAAAMCALSLWATAHRTAWLDGSIFLGIALALAASAASTFPTKGDRSTFWRKQLPLIALTLGVAFAIAGPWYIRTYLIFGDVLGLTTHLAMPWARPEAVGVDRALQAMPLTVLSFWLAFGWGTISTARSTYIILNMTALICLLCTGLYFFKCRDRAKRWAKNESNYR